MPEPAYYAAVNEFYAGQYRDAERAFRRMTRTGVQANQARWIDSICYNAMLGEVLYHQGRNAEALASFDQACLMLLSYPDFMRQVKFEEPRPEGNPQRVQVPWGPGSRQVNLGNYPRTMQVMVGSLTGAAAGAAARRDVFAGAVLASERGGGDSHRGAGNAAAERDSRSAGEARPNFQGAGDDDVARKSYRRESLVAGLDRAVGGDRQGRRGRGGRGEDASRPGGAGGRDV